MPSGPLLNDLLDSGLEPADKQDLDLQNTPLLRRRVTPAERAMNRAQADAYEAGVIQAPAAGEDIDPMMLPPPITAADLQPPQPPMYQYPPGTPATQVPQPPVYQQPPLNPQDTEPVRKRINKLYGQWKGAEERASSFEERALRAEARLADMAATPALGPPAYAQYQPPQPPAYQNRAALPEEGPTPPPADYVSRQELQNLLFGQTRYLMEQQRIQRAQESARAEAEADFPDVFTNPELREQYNLVMQRDQFLQQDPAGPYKAAALARGLNNQPGQLPPGGYAPPAARKVQLAGMGATIPSGPPTQPLNERAALYQAALNHARRTGQMADFARARRIQMGLPG